MKKKTLTYYAKHYSKPYNCVTAMAYHAFGESGAICPQCRPRCPATRSDRRQRARADRGRYGVLVDGSHGAESRRHAKKLSARPAPIILILMTPPEFILGAAAATAGVAQRACPKTSSEAKAAKAPKKTGP